MQQQHLTMNDFDVQDGRPKHPSLRHGSFFVMLASGGCGHCRNAMPEFLKLHHPRIPRYVVESTSQDASERQLASAIQSWMGKTFVGYPTFLLFQPDGRLLEYGGKERTAQAWYAWLESQR